MKYNNYKTRLTCNFCEKTYTYNLNANNEIRCKNCGEYDLELTDYGVNENETHFHRHGVSTKVDNERN